MMIACAIARFLSLRDHRPGDCVVEQNLLRQMLESASGFVAAALAHRACVINEVNPAAKSMLRGLTENRLRCVGDQLCKKENRAGEPRVGRTLGDGIAVGMLGNWDLETVARANMRSPVTLGQSEDICAGRGHAADAERWRCAMVEGSRSLWQPCIVNCRTGSGVIDVGGRCGASGGRRW